jgi:hypothetical protein
MPQDPEKDGRGGCVGEVSHDHEILHSKRLGVEIENILLEDHEPLATMALLRALRVAFREKAAELLVFFHRPDSSHALQERDREGTRPGTDLQDGVGLCQRPTGDQRIPDPGIDEKVLPQRFLGTNSEAAEPGHLRDVV